MNQYYLKKISLDSFLDFLEGFLTGFNETRIAVVDRWNVFF